MRRVDSRPKECSKTIVPVLASPPLGRPLRAGACLGGGGGVTSEGTWDRSFWQGIASCPEIGSVCSSAPGSDLGIRTIGGGEEALSTNSYALAETDRDCPVH